MNRIRPSDPRRACLVLPPLAALVLVPLLGGCTGSTAESAPVSDAEIKEGRDRQIKAVQNNPNMPPEAKKRAMEHFGGGAPSGRR